MGGGVYEGEGGGDAMRVTREQSAGARRQGKTKVRFVKCRTEELSKRLYVKGWEGERERGRGREGERGARKERR